MKRSFKKQPPPHEAWACDKKSILRLDPVWSPRFTAREPPNVGTSYPVRILPSGNFPIIFPLTSLAKIALKRGEGSTMIQILDIAAMGAIVIFLFLVG